MAPQDVLFVTVCGIGTVNGVCLAVYLLRSARGAVVLNRLLAVLVLTFSVRVGKAVAMLFLGRLHPLFELLWIATLAATGVAGLIYALHFTGQAQGAGRRLAVGGIAALVSTAAVFLLLPLSPTWRLMAGALAVYAAAVGSGLPAATAWWRGAEADRVRRSWMAAVAVYLGATWALHASLIGWRLRGPVSEDAFFNAEALFFSAAACLLVYLDLTRGLLARLHQPVAQRIDPEDPALRRLRHAVEDERLFLDAELSLPGLARNLRLTPQHVSRLVNAGIGSSFNDYVNRLRVEEACRILAGPDGPSRKIGSLAYECGFGSPSVFYAAFRKFTGRTPSEYEKSLARG